MAIPLALEIIDVDPLSLYNDQYAHAQYNKLQTQAQRKAANDDDVEFQTAKNDLNRQADDLKAKYGAVAQRDGEAGTKELEQRLLRQVQGLAFKTDS